jgi:hypothetical protein
MIQMDIKKFAQETFKLDKRIRYVGVVDNQFHILLSQMRDGVQSVTTDEQEHNFVQIMPPIIVDAVEKMEPILGELDRVTVRYEKVTLMFYRLEDLVVILSLEPKGAAPPAESFSESMRKVAPLLRE